MTLRYRWRFAVPILRTLLNDIPIMLGVYAISGREVSSATVAAILTILGYSVYDTIIVFDRVRENLRLMPRASIATIVNVSVSEVLKRSIVTSTITLLPIIALFIFGGATLQDFAFAIIVGIAVGAVSTIFIATPILSSLLERDPEYAGRRGEACDEKMRAKIIREAEMAAAGLPAETPVEQPRRRSPSGSAPPKVRARRSPRTPSANGGASGASRGRMDDPGNDVFDERDPLDRLLSHARRRSSTSCASSSTRRPRAGAATRCASARGPATRMNTIFYELGLITREDWDELDLRVAQLEHRLRLIEERLDSTD